MRTIRIPTLAVVIASMLAQVAAAQSPARQPSTTSPLGVWRGTSTCLVRPSPCHDEIVVYRISQAKGADSVMLDARKIVSGEEQEMGVLTCHFTSPNGPLTCVIPHGTWQFRVRNDSLVGELLQRDNTRFRDVRTARASN